jgi:hypothetical protein
VTCGIFPPIDVRRHCLISISYILLPCHGRGRAQWVSNGAQVLLDSWCPMEHKRVVQTGVETPTLPRERADIVALVAADPECGDLIRGTGGFRKVRAARKGMGKWWARVVYIWRNERFPVFLITVLCRIFSTWLARFGKGVCGRPSLFPSFGYKSQSWQMSCWPPAKWRILPQRQTSRAFAERRLQRSFVRFGMVGVPRELLRTCDFAGIDGQEFVG